MKLDYLEEFGDMCPLIRLSQFTGAEIQRLRQTCADIAEGSSERICFDAMESVESVDGTELTFVRGARDRGVVKTGEKQFEVVLAPEGWRQTAEFIDPFCNGSLGFQWLTPNAGRIKWLLSKDGSW